MELKHFPSRMKCHPVIELLARICAVWKFSVLFLKVISSVNHHSHRGCVRVNVTQSSYSPRMLCTQSQGKQYFVHILLLPKNYEKYSVCVVRKCVWGLTHGTQGNISSPILQRYFKVYYKYKKDFDNMYVF